MLDAVNRYIEAVDTVPDDQAKLKHQCVTIHQHIYKWYQGGITKVNPIHQGKLIKNVTSYDINSSYPSIMNSKKKIPVGIPIVGRNAPADYDFRLYKIHIIKDIIYPLLIDNKVALINHSFLSI
jgi:hypothetical protein